MQMERESGDNLQDLFKTSCAVEQTNVTLIDELEVARQMIWATIV